jgi:L-lactate dehydrogenase complex protein LldG
MREPTGSSAHVKNRQAILDRLDTCIIPSDSLPEWDNTQLITFDDPITHFIDLLTMVGGQAHFVDGAEQVEAILAQIPVYRDAKRVASVVPEMVKGNVDVNAIDDPHSLASLDWMIARGEFLVAENGAIWIDGKTLPHRVMLFIAQYLAIVVSRSEFVTHLHQAYDRLGQPQSPYGVFVSGPSKTADIEQSLVIGAHGCRSLQVFLLP